MIAMRERSAFLFACVVRLRWNVNTSFFVIVAVSIYLGWSLTTHVLFPVRGNKALEQYKGTGLCHSYFLTGTQSKKERKDDSEVGCQFHYMSYHPDRSVG